MISDLEKLHAELMQDPGYAAAYAEIKRVHDIEDKYRKFDRRKLHKRRKCKGRHRRGNND